MNHTEQMTMQSRRPLICDTDQTKGLLHVSRTTLWELGRQGKLEVVYIGRRRFFTYESICAFVESLPTSNGGALK